MSVLIKGMDMPEDCMFCPAFHGDWGMCGVLGQTTVIAGKHPDCPLVEVPAHGRLIDADALYRRVKTECNPYGKPTINFDDGNKVMDMIEDAPTIIEAEDGE